MKKIIVIVLVIVLSGIAVYEVYNLFLKRTPEKLLKQQFNISLKDFDYSIETFEEEWCLNGDGELLIVIKFNELTQKNIEYFKTDGKFDGRNTDYIRHEARCSRK